VRPALSIDRGRWRIEGLVRGSALRENPKTLNIKNVMQEMGNLLYIF